jgi:diguanylate cyclase (GGDEF)-like protein
MSEAEAASEVSSSQSQSALAAHAYAPYAQLIKMLLPRSAAVAIYDHNGELTWCSEGYDKPEFRELVTRYAHANSGDLRRGLLRETSSGQAAFHVALAAADRDLGTMVIELGETRQPWNEKVVRGLLTPVLRCLENTLELEHSMGSVQSGDDSAALDLLLGVDEDNPAGPSPLHRLLQHTVEHLDSAVGALVITDKNLVVSCDASGSETTVSSDLLSRTQKNLLAWAQLNNRTMLVNRIGGLGHSPAYKILSCPVHNAAGTVTGVLALFRESSQRDFDLKEVRILEFIARRAVAILNSRHDSLTGLANRLIFEGRVQAQLDGNQKIRHALLYIDIDRLQAINEAFGYQAGDEVIQRLAEATQKVLRPVDMASRLGGDRIAIFLHGYEIDDAQALADDLVAKMSRLSYLRDQQSLRATISVGLVQPDGDRQKFSHVLAAAEIACKEAKRKGGNCVVTALGRRSKRRPPKSFHESINLQQALDNNEFRLQAQPIVGLAISTDEVMGQEILLRLRDKDGRLLAPEKFLDIAQRYHLMTAIDRWVVASTIRALKDADVALGPLSQLITLNVSAQSLQTPDFSSFVLGEVEQAGLPPEAFRFEMKESVAVEHVAAASRFIKDVRQAGSQVGLDDFGVRLSSFTDLKDLPVSYLKIDGGLIRRIADDTYAESVVQGIVKAAEILGVFTIAEHVETESLAEKLREYEVSFGQGFHLGRPRPLEAVFAQASIAV